VRVGISWRSRLALLALGAAALALLGTPWRSRVDPSDELRGSVRSVEGRALAGVRVALFDARSRALIATSHTDAHGRFTFAGAPDRVDLLALPDAASGLAPRWRRSIDVASSHGVAFALPSARPLRVRVRDARGAPVADASVRVYERDGEPDRRAAVIATAATDSDGAATLLAPERAHVGVVPSGSELAPEWALDVEVPIGGATVDVELDAAFHRRGRVVDERGTPMAGVVVGSWSAAEPREWHGFAISGANGEFEIALDARGARLAVADPLGRAVATALDAGAGREPLAIRLADGRAIDVRCTDSNGRAVAATLRVHAPESDAWSWSVETGRAGSAQVVVPPSFGVAARPASRVYTRVLLSGRDSAAGPFVLTLPRALDVAAIPPRRRGG
jgi:5-hydroxyisourate hydrolase-like protein (transthyretin family)